jgi:hypothetical protein
VIVILFVVYLFVIYLFLICLFVIYYLFICLSLFDKVKKNVVLNGGTCKTPSCDIHRLYAHIKIRSIRNLPV